MLKYLLTVGLLSIVFVPGASAQGDDVVSGCVDITAETGYIVCAWREESPQSGGVACVTTWWDYSSTPPKPGTKKSVCAYDTSTKEFVCYYEGRNSHIPDECYLQPW